MADFSTGDNGGNPDSESGIPNRDALFALFAPVQVLRLRLAAAASLRSIPRAKTQSCLIVPNQA
jgi:hypothetical protein